METPWDQDLEDNQVIGVLSYLVFFLPWITEAKDSPFATLHGKQSLAILLFAFGVGCLGSIPIVGWFFIWPLGSFLCIVWWMWGVILAVKGSMKPIPLIAKLAMKFQLA